MLRFRPIMMTPCAHLRCPAARLWNRHRLGTAEAFGITIVGGLLLSQILTLYTTPVIYLMMDRLRLPPSADPRHNTPANGRRNGVVMTDIQND